MKHKDYDMIVAKAANMELVLFIEDDGKWVRTNPKAFFDYPDSELFLCLPQHKEAVLHALNGGQAQATNEVGNGDFQDVYTGKPIIHWTSGGWYMSDKCESRIKPKKEKRWLRYSSKGVLKEEYNKPPQIMYECDQIIEIEVEV